MKAYCERFRRAFGQAAAALIIAFVILVKFAAAQQKAIPKSSGQSAQERAANFERPERDRWQKPQEVIKVLELKDGTVVADIGAGSGYFSRRFAKAVAPSGKVYAVDIDKEILEYLRKRAQAEKITNIEIIVSKEDDPMLPADSIDLAFFADTTHHIANRVSFYRTLSKALKKGARMAIIDYPPEAHDKGFCHHLPEELVTASQVKSEAEEAGFKLVKEFDFLLPRQYFLVFEKR
jgi:arsenite methyltransferase